MVKLDIVHSHIGFEISQGEIFEIPCIVYNYGEIVMLYLWYTHVDC